MRRAELVLCVLAATCKQHPEVVQKAPVVADPVANSSASASASAVASADPPPAPYPSSCSAFDRDLNAKLQAALDARGDAGTTYGNEQWTPAKLRAAVADSGLGCLPFARGAWIVEPGADIDVWSSLLVTTDARVRAALDGKVLDPWSPLGGMHVGYGGMPTSMTRRIVTDYDGDGVPELWVRTDEDGVEGGHFAPSFILTVHDGRVTEYAPATGLGEIATPVDVDGDGRLDLPASLGLAIFDQGSCFGKGDDKPADMFAHSLEDGTFSKTDAVAMAHVKKWCPAMPATISTRTAALCARLWTAPADVKATRARIAASCVRWDCAREIAGGAQKPGASMECDDMLNTFDQTISFTLH
jgi:hypothetical protein